MSDFNPGNQPGLRTKKSSDEAQILWSGRGGQDLAAVRQGTLASTSVDSGASPTTSLRPGLVLAIHGTSGKFLPYDPDANDGTQIAVGVLERGQDMLVDGVATDRFVPMLVHGFVKEGELVGLDPRAKGQLARRFVFDRDLPCGADAQLRPRGVVRKAADYSVVEADDGLLFLASAAVVFTLPTRKNGLAFRFVQTANSNLTINGGGHLVHKGNAAATTVTFSTTNEKIGSHALVECVYVDTDTLKWVVTNLGGTTATVA